MLQISTGLPVMFDYSTHSDHYCRRSVHHQQCKNFQYISEEKASSLFLIPRHFLAAS